MDLDFASAGPKKRLDQSYSRNFCRVELPSNRRRMASNRRRMASNSKASNLWRRIAVEWRRIAVDWRRTAPILRFSTWNLLFQLCSTSHLLFSALHFALLLSADLYEPYMPESARRCPSRKSQSSSVLRVLRCELKVARSKLNVRS